MSERIDGGAESARPSARQFLREFLTGIGGPIATVERLRLATWVRLLFVLPGFFLPTLAGMVVASNFARDATVSQLVADAWIALFALYALTLAAILASGGKRPRLERALNYLCLLLEISTNHLVLYTMGTLGNHAMVNAAVAVAVYRVFFDFRLGLLAAAYPAALFCLTTVAELAGFIPIAPGAPDLYAHPAYHDVSTAISIMVVTSAGLLLAFAAINYGVNQALKLHRYITESVLRRYLPAPLVARAARGELRLDAPAERRVVTVMFTDLVGFTQLSERLGADALGRLLNGYLSRMSEVAHRHGATVDKFVGDAIMIVFGAPEPMEPAEQAWRCVDLALELQATIPLVAPEHGLQARTGINTGEAVAGNFGSLVRSDYTVLGPAVNVAARLESAATPGRILIGPETARLLGGRVPLESAGELRLKGVSAPVGAWYLARQRPTASKAACAE